MELLNQILAHPSTIGFILILGAYLGFRFGMRLGASLTFNQIMTEAHRVAEEMRKSKIDELMGRIKENTNEAK